MHVIMKKIVLTKKFNYRKLMSLGAILICTMAFAGCSPTICTMAFAGCSPTSNKNTNQHITKTEHVKKHKNVKKTTASSSSSSSKASSSSSVATAATSSSQPAVTHTTTSTSRRASVQSNKPVAQHSTATATTKAHAQTTSGFNVNGHHFDIGSFSGTGLVPADKVYQWTSLRGWYLIDINSVAAFYTSSLGVGSPVTVNGRTYHVTHVLYNRPNNSNTFNTVVSMLGSNAIGWQTCTSHSRMSNLNLWFAN